MRKPLSPIVACLGCAAALVLSLPAADDKGHWPQWRGPNFNGTAGEGSPPLKWSESSGVKWKVAVPGSGTSTPIIWGERLFLQTAVPTGKKAEGVPAADAAPPPQQRDGQEPGRRRGGGGGGGGFRGEKPTDVYRFALLCIDRTNGRTLWEKTVREELPHEGHHRDHGFSSHSPVTDGKHVWAWFGSRGLHCFDMDGNAKWSKDLGRMQTRNAFGEGSSPALSGDTIVVNWDHEGDDFIAAFDTSTGAERWRKPRNEATTWTTPLIVEHDGKKQVIVAASDRVRSYDLATGNEIWSCGGMVSNVIPVPVTAEGIVYVMSGHRGAALLAIKLGRTGDLTDTDAIVWRHDKRTPYVPSPLLAGGRLYFHSGNDAYFSCFDAATGKPLVEAERIPGMSGIYASPVAAAGRIYLTGRDGAFVVLKQSDKMEILATNKLDDRFDASPAIAGNALYLRGHKSLYCLAE